MVERELGWDDVISKETDFILLPEGDYDFKVSKIERKRYAPGPNAKLPPCNMVEITMVIESDKGSAHIFDNLYLHTRTEGMLSAFFLSIGHKKKGEELKMDWNKVVGACGRATIEINEYVSSTGETRQNNRIKRFLVPERSSVNMSEPIQTQPTQNFQAGNF